MAGEGEVMGGRKTESASARREGPDGGEWSKPLPEVLPRPTYWPAVTALAIVLALWGILTSLLVTAVGLSLFAVALGGWIGELRQARRICESSDDD